MFATRTFRTSHRLAVTTGGEAWVYDTMDHQIGGFSQQQGIGGSITFTSQFGTVNLSTLPVVSRGGVPQTPAAAILFRQPLFRHRWSLNPNQLPSSSDADPKSPARIASVSGRINGTTPDSSSQEDIIDTLDRLGGLMEKGYITEEEFASKKSELLGRL